ncbi:MAG: hypothetical protein ACFB16_24570 [Phormidesmis sp.]
MQMNIARISIAALCSVTSWLALVSPARANCNDTVASPEWYTPILQEHISYLQSDEHLHNESYRAVLDSVEGRNIFVTEAFDNLDGAAKSRVLSELQSFRLSDYLTPEELEQKLSMPGSQGMGTWPYDVTASDGRRVLEVYDGCTVLPLLTERDRFGLYFNRHFQPGKSTSQGEMRNAGTPHWRQVNFPIEASTEQAVRLGFWNSVGYDSSGWWIAWVPEQGHFEMNVPEGFDADKLQRYWQVAERDYNYVVVRNDGTELGVKQF